MTIRVLQQKEPCQELSDLLEDSCIWALGRSKLHQVSEKIRKRGVLVLDLVLVLDSGALKMNFWALLLKLQCWFYGLMVLVFVLL